MDALSERTDPAFRLIGIEQAAARVVDGMDLQDDLVEIADERLEGRRAHPGRQRRDGKRQRTRQPRPQFAEEVRVGRQLRRRAIVVDLQARQRRGGDPGHDLVEQPGHAFVVEPAVDADDTHDGPSGRGDIRPRHGDGRPQRGLITFGEENAPAAHDVGGVPGGGDDRRRPGPLPDVGVVQQGLHGGANPRHRSRQSDHAKQQRDQQPHLRSSKPPAVYIILSSRAQAKDLIAARRDYPARDDKGPVRLARWLISM
jgi:hypothetical protein